MAINDSLLNTLQSYIGPGFINRVSKMTGLPPDTIKAGINSILPALLMGIVNKGSNVAGAQALLNMIRQGGFDSRAPDEAIREFEGEQTTVPLQRGNDIVRNIFGNHLDTIAERLSRASGLPSSGITKVLSMLAPLAMTVLGSRVKKGSFNASSLMGFLSSQQPSLAKLVPADVIPKPEVAGGVLDRVRESSGVHYGERRGVSWMTMGLLALLALGGYLLTRGPGDRMIAPTDMEETVQAQPQALSDVATPASELDAFLAAGDGTNLPQRFQFEELTFETATTNLVSGSEAELDRIAATLNQYPGVNVRIEGFTDSTGNPEFNMALSLARANKVKEELVTRGVDANRLETVGRGAANPVAPNDTEENRAKNRRIELIVVDM